MARNNLSELLQLVVVWLPAVVCYLLYVGSVSTLVPYHVACRRQRPFLALERRPPSQLPFTLRPELPLCACTYLASFGQAS
jgi:hypothetical protein